MKHEDRKRRLFSVFFPSLSRDIIWKVGVVSRVRFAAQKPRAHDTTPTFQPNLLIRKRREGVANRNHGRPQPATQTQTSDPSALAYSGPKMVLTMGSTLATHDHSSVLRQNHLPRFVVEDHVGEFVRDIAGLAGTGMARIVDNHIVAVQHATYSRPPPRITD